MDDSHQTDAITTIKLPVPSCTLSRADVVELARPVEDMVGEDDSERPTFVIEGRDRTLTCRSLDALQQSSWPRDVQKVRFMGEGEGGREITLYASVEAPDLNHVEISGADAHWVRGVGEYYRQALNERRNWHWLVNNWLLMGLLVFLVASFWVPRLFPHVDVHSGMASRAALLRRRAGSAIAILVLIGLSVAGNVLYNLLR